MAPKQGTRVLAAGLAIALSLSLSGCFFFSSFKWSDVAVKAGKSTYAKIGLLPAAGNDQFAPQRTYPTVLLGFGSPTKLTLGGKSRFDTQRRFGGPYQMAQDGALAAATIGSDNCEFGGQHLEDISGVATWKAVRTDVKVSDRDKVGLLAQAKVQIKAAAGAPANQEQLYVVTGDWTDGDDNHNPTENEVGCTGGIVSTLTISG